MCASWPYSIKHSILNLLLNPPLDLGFIKTFVWIKGVLGVENLAHFFPSHRLHLDLMFLCVIIMLAFAPF